MPKSPTPNPVHESITSVTVNAGSKILDVRVWRTEETPYSIGNPKEIHETAKKVSDLMDNDTPRHEAIKCVAECFTAMPRVSAVEVRLRGLNCGVVFYPDWK